MDLAAGPDAHQGREVPALSPEVEPVGLFPDSGACAGPPCVPAALSHSRQFVDGLVDLGVGLLGRNGDRPGHAVPGRALEPGSGPPAVVVHPAAAHGSTTSISTV